MELVKSVTRLTWHIPRAGTGSGDILSCGSVSHCHSMICCNTHHSHTGDKIFSMSSKYLLTASTGPLRSLGSEERAVIIQ